jgi:putative membrane protein
MTERSFYLAESKARVTDAVREVEAQTSAELVVAVRHSSDAYRDIDYSVGFAVALAALALLLFSDVPYRVDWMPVDIMVAFLVGVFAAQRAPPLRRFLLGARRAKGTVETAARAAFYDRGIAHTHRRGGILVFVSTFERKVVVLPDVGVDAALLGEPWTLAIRSLEDAIVGGLDFERFAAGLRSLGPVLAKALPHHEGDVNELPDEVDAS